MRRDLPSLGFAAKFGAVFEGGREVLSATVLEGGNLAPGAIFWVIGHSAASSGSWSFEPLLIRYGSERVLAVFTDEGQAEAFVWCMVLEGSPEAVRRSPDGRFTARDLQPRICGRGELISLLVGSRSGQGPCDEIERVVLDPSPETFASGGPGDPSVEASCVSRKSFVETLVENARVASRGVLKERR